MQGGKTVFVDSKDLFNTLMSHPKTPNLRKAAGDTYVEVQSGGAAVMARVVEAAINPTEGQRMLQAGFDGEILNECTTRFCKNPALALKEVFAMGVLNDSCLEGKEITQMKPAQLNEKGEDIGGHWNLSDSVSALTGCTPEEALQWVNKHIDAIKTNAPSLTYIDVNHLLVSFITLTQIHTRIHTSQYKHIFKC